MEEGRYSFGEFSIAPGGRQVFQGTRTIPLPPKTFDVLYLLVRNPGDLVSRSEISASIWPGSMSLTPTSPISWSPYARFLGRTRSRPFQNSAIGSRFRSTAIDMLRRARSAGFSSSDSLQSDPAFRELRDHPDFQCERRKLQRLEEQARAALHNVLDHFVAPQ